MKRLELVPEGWPCTLAECPSGLFVFGETLALANDYGEYFLAVGDAFWGGVKSKEERALLVVQPVVARWVETEGDE